MSQKNGNFFLLLQTFLRFKMIYAVTNLMFSFKIMSPIVLVLCNSIPSFGLATFSFLAQYIIRPFPKILTLSYLRQSNPFYFPIL